MTQRHKLIEKSRMNPAGIRFREICLPAKHLGFSRRGGKGSHVVYEKEGIVEILRYPLRIPEDLRRRLELEAKRKGISLNQLILRRIA